MSVQRYKFHGRGRLAGYTEEMKDGEWVKFSDHQSSLAEGEQRIKELEESLELIRGTTMKAYCKTCNGPQEAEFRSNDDEAVCEDICCKTCDSILATVWDRPPYIEKKRSPIEGWHDER